MFEQGTPEWHEQRLGKFTASRVADIMARTRSGYAASRNNYIMEVVLERLTGKREETYTNAFMQRGTELEPEAMSEYEKLNLVTVDPAPFVLHPEMSFLGASPDGLIGDDGLIEVKCRKAALHYDYLIAGKIEKKTLIQMHVQMMCTERPWCDFVSYHPDFPDNLKLWQHRVDLDPDLVSEIVTEVKSAEKEAFEIIEKLSSL